MNSLRNARQAKGLRLVDAAKALGTHPGNLSRIEAGQQFPRIALAQRMASLYGMSLEEVFEVPPDYQSREPSRVAA